ncbi:hypothetical protein MRX96_039557 [Rhipicephalus microplus]
MDFTVFAVRQHGATSADPPLQKARRLHRHFGPRHCRCGSMLTHHVSAGAAFCRRGPAVVCLTGWPTDYSHRRFWRVLGYTFEQLFRAPQPVFSGFGWFAAKSGLYGVRRPATWCNIG